MLTRSRLDVRLGVVEPQIKHLPPAVASLAAAEEAIELADAYGLAGGYPLDESQRITLRAGLGERADGSWAATQVGDFKGRQGGGKSVSIEARELAGLILFEEDLIIHTAHEFPTANESFLRLVSVFENWDDLRKRVRRVLYGNGTQSINLLSGQRILYKARTGGAGRGFSQAALVVYDEAQHLEAEHVAASGPTRLAHPNSQSWYAGSGGLAKSKMAWRLRRRALSGDGGRLAYVENTAETITVKEGRVSSSAPDPDDRDAWAMANPGLGRWVTEEALESLYDELGPELFARECLCIWEPDPGAEVEHVVPMDRWEACEDEFSSFVGPPMLAVDVTPDRARSSIAAAGLRADGLPHVEIVDNRAGTAWVTARLKELRAKWSTQGVVADLSGPAGSLFKKDEVQAVTTNDHKQACGLFYDAVTEKMMRHRVDPRLDVALRGATKRDVGDAWLWSRRSSQVDISPLVAATLAMWAANQSPAEAGFKNLDDYLDDE